MLEWFGVVWCGLVWFGSVWFGLVGFGRVWVCGGLECGCVLTRLEGRGRLEDGWSIEDVCLLAGKDGCDEWKP